MGNFFSNARQGVGRFSQMPPRAKRSRAPEEASASNNIIPKRINCLPVPGQNPASEEVDGRQAEEQPVQDQAPDAENDSSKQPIHLDLVSQEGFLIDQRYEVLTQLGSGSFGLLLKVKDQKRDGCYNALKISKDEYGDEDVRKEARVLKKIMLLDAGNKYHIVRLCEDFMWEQRYCLTFELMPMNLAQYVRRIRRTTGLQMSETRIVCYQILDALDFLFEHRIVHCDLKPQNIMVRDIVTLEIKVIDFGSAESTEELVWANITYFQTRYYRAPEVMLGIPLTPALDIWSFGCIMAELHTGRVIFKGENDENQFNHIIEVLDMPQYSLLLRGRFTYKYFSKSNSSRRGVYKPITPPDKPPLNPGSRPLEQVLRRNLPGPSNQANEDFIIELVFQMLQYDADNRITPSKAKKHRLFHGRNKKNFSDFEISRRRRSLQPYLVNLA